MKMLSSRPAQHVLYQQRGFPVMQNRLYATREEALACPVGDILLVQDPDTGIVHNAAFDESLIEYDEEYQNDQSFSPAFKAHMETVLAIVKRHFATEPVIEIGCGKGRFLQMLLDAGVDAMGVDPAYEGNSDRVVRSYFTRETPVRPGHIILRHVLEHIPNPLEFLHDIRTAAGPGKKIFIEVPCLDWILKNNAWYDIYYEHVNYFRLDDFSRIFRRIHDSGHLFGGQYIYVIADLDSLVTDAPAPRGSLHFPRDFGPRPLSTTAEKVFVWGAASKGVIYTLMQVRKGAVIDGCIDINPHKQGRFLPLTGIQVLAPEEAFPLLTPETLILVANPNYLDEIKDMSRHCCRYEIIR